MKTIDGTRVLVLTILLLAIPKARPSYAALVPTMVHQFTARDAANIDGANPMDILSAGNRFYGLTFSGGGFGHGVIFGIDPDGSNFQVLHAFDQDGENPSQTRPLLLSGSTLFGVDRNTFIYALSIDGAGYHHIYDFADADAGYNPECALTLDGDTLYGTTTLGGLIGNGTIFAVTTNGDNPRILYSFSGFDDPTTLTNLDGAKPRAGLTLEANVLYGSSEFGGKGNGTIFKINTDGSGFTVLHTFSDGQGQLYGPNSDGIGVAGKLVLSSGKLYGATRYGGTTGNGVFFSINSDGSAFKLINTFLGQPDLSVGDPGPLILAGQKIYGSRPSGGANKRGLIFEYDIPSATFKTIYNFTALSAQSTNTDGIQPQSGMALAGNKLYFTASGGGPSRTGTIGYLQLEFSAPTLEILQTDQGVRILLHGESGVAYTLEQTENLQPTDWFQPQSITVIQNPQPIDLSLPAAPTFWRARYP